MKRTSVIILLMLLFVAPAFCAAPFVDLKFEEACKQAARENKIVLVDFYTEWCGPCKLLDQKTWPDAAVMKLLEEKTIPLRIDAEQEAQLAARYKVSIYPTVLLLKPDGTEIDRLCGFAEPPVFISNFNDSLAGKDSVARAREAVAKAGGKDPMTRETLGNVFAQKERYDEALVEYLWCFDHGVEFSPGYVGVRLSFLISDIVHLGRQYPDAISALEERRNAEEKKALAGTADRMALLAVVRLDDALNQKQKSLELFDKLPPESRALMLRDVAQQLIEAKRYKDVLENADPQAAFDRQIADLKSRMDAMKDNPNLKMFEQAMNANIVASGECFFEALAGTGKDDAAMAMAGKILKFSTSETTRAELVQSAKRAGNNAVAEKLVEH